MLAWFYITFINIPVHILLQLWLWLPSICNTWISRQYHLFPRQLYTRKLVLECITSVHMLYWLSANIPEKNTTCGISLMVQCLRLLTPNERGLCSIPGQGTIAHMPQLRVCIPQKRSKILRAKTNTWHSHMNTRGTSLVIQWLRIFLAVQGTQVWSLVRELRSHLLQGTQALVPQLRHDRAK